MTAQFEWEEIAAMSAEERARYDAEVPERVVRFGDIRPEWGAYRETHLPGHERAIYGYVGAAASDNEAYASRLKPGENFSVVVVGADPGKGAALHAHTTEEMFVVLSGRFGVYWGDRGQHQVVLERWDAVTVPAPVMRGFWNAGTEHGHLMAIQGGGSPPPSIYSPEVLRRIEASTPAG